MKNPRETSPIRILTGLLVVNLEKMCEMMTPIVSQVAPSSSLRVHVRVCVVLVLVVGVCECVLL